MYEEINSKIIVDYYLSHPKTTQHTCITIVSIFVVTDISKSPIARSVKSAKISTELVTLWVLTIHVIQSVTIQYKELVGDFYGWQKSELTQWVVSPKSMWTGTASSCVPATLYSIHIIKRWYHLQIRDGLDDQGQVGRTQEMLTGSGRNPDWPMACWEKHCLMVYLYITTYIIPKMDWNSQLDIVTDLLLYSSEAVGHNYWVSLHHRWLLPAPGPGTDVPAGYCKGDMYLLKERCVYWRRDVFIER